MFQQIVQTAASSLIVITACLYAVGWFVVTVHLGKYKMTEYQIISAHYLVVGTFFLFNLIFSLVIGFMLAAFLGGVSVVVDNNQRLSIPLYVLLAISVIANVVLLLPTHSAFRLISRLLKFVKSKATFFRSIVLIYPFAVAFRYTIPTLTNTVSQWDSPVAYMILGIAIVALVYDYALRIYGAPISDNDDRVSAGIGTGAPRTVQFVGKKESMYALALIGITLATPELTDEIFLLAETSSHYIVTRSLDDTSEAVKIRKDDIFALRHKGAC